MMRCTNNANALSTGEEALELSNNEIVEAGLLSRDGTTGFSEQVQVAKDQALAVARDHDNPFRVHRLPIFLSHYSSKQAVQPATNRRLYYPVLMFFYPSPFP